MTAVPMQMTFFEFLTPLVASGQKTITIRDASESHYQPGSQVEVFTLEGHSKVCDIIILAVEPLKFDDINEFHATQESLPLAELKQLILKVYPNKSHLFMISFKLMAA
ncbi:N(4)-acetylcytidine aminohydrolase [Shewanella livingstonensis]|uniref:N(4)-acetylcytidine amidohydrolase n=1 Tax=Shewanella livingstonensis TaxID=150120 RepID=A0A3G8LQ64_9GAMM|nr:N(4)-acetylcytidine aminohydrolase [Shewanella livingstonensis]AZG71564.1 ASCH domain-containing protein [Shewanella livingstonensis]